MKVYTLFCCFFFYGSVFAQNCSVPIVDKLFQPKYEQVKAQPDDELRFDVATMHLGANCYTSLQIKYFARLFIQDEIRYNYAKLAYKNCTDIENFYDVLDAFKGHGYAFRLYDYLNSIKNLVKPQPVTPVAPAPCRVSETDFTQIKTSINNESVSSTQIAVAKQIVSTKKCFSSLQIKEIINLFSVESYRLEFAKYAYTFTTDKANYYQIVDAFSTTSSKNQLLEFIGNK